MPRPVVAISQSSVGHDWEHEPHVHNKAQIIFTVRGIINCTVEDGVWIVPSQCAIWIPSGLMHSAKGSGETECYCLFIDPNVVPNLPKVCCTISVSLLLGELFIRVSRFPALYPLKGAETRLIATLLDELIAAPIDDLHLPMPKDNKLRKLANMVLASPSDKALVKEWAIRIGMSERSLSRLLSQEIGMSFGKWRRQMHIIISLQRLSKGESVQTVALDLGYENASGFVTMFRKALGKPPARYLTERKNKIALDEQHLYPAIVFPKEGDS
ncbi:helix-turn-helix transcriptional regulator [Pseudoalteromonas sp. NCIMB_1079]|uniref:AraC family transcriptional regulator n=1 Tax=Pseudoalteromonas sp. NCIMB 1079 TaxID=3142847 RepID=UPI00339CFEAE